MPRYSLKKLTDEDKILLDHTLDVFYRLPKSVQKQLLNDDKLENEFLDNMLSDHMQGGGIGDFIRNAFHSTVRGTQVFGRTLKRGVKRTFGIRDNDYNNQSKKMIIKYGDDPIIRLQIYRTPISSMLNKLIDWVSLGQWSKLKQKYSFDSLFHLALVVTVRTAKGFEKNIIVEKNEDISISDKYETSDLTEALNVPLNGLKLDLKELLTNARQRYGDKRFFLYDAFSEKEGSNGGNCQLFIHDLLEASGLLTPNINEFLYQDLGELAEELNPITKKIIRGVTDAGAVVSKVTGKGKKKLKGSGREELEKLVTDFLNSLEVKESDINKKMSREKYRKLHKDGYLIPNEMFMHELERIAQIARMDDASVDEKEEIYESFKDELHKLIIANKKLTTLTRVQSGKNKDIKPAMTDILKERKDVTDISSSEENNGGDSTESESFSESEDEDASGGLDIPRWTGAGKNKYKLHSIVIKKPITMSQVRQIEHHIMKDKKNRFTRETKQSIRVRIVPKTKFVKKSFRTHKVNKQISLIYGIPK